MKGDTLTLKSVRVASSIPILVVVAHDINYVAELSDCSHQIRAIYRMALKDCALFCGQLGGFCKNRCILRAHLANVMEHTRYANLVDLNVIEA